MRISKNLILYITFFQIIINISCQQYIPRGRVYHTATLIGTRIYFLGGLNNDSLLTNDFFYLDISKSFNKIEGPLPFVNVTLSGSIPKHYGATTSAFGKSKSSIFFFGGDIGALQLTIELAYTLDTTQSPLIWKNIAVSSNEVERRRLLSAVADNNNKIYLFGGGGRMGDIVYMHYNIMNIFDNATDSWTYTIDNTIIKREGHTATFLSDTGEIVYIGGCGDNGTLIDMTIVFRCNNTISGTWQKWETKNPPEQRCQHTAALTTDNRIIVFGGIDSLELPVENYYVVLNTKTLEWYHGNESITGAPYRGHTATFYNNYMFVAFGQGITQQASNDILIYEIKDGANFAEVDYYNIPVDNTPFNYDLIMGITTFSIIVLGFIGLVIFMYIKQKKKKPAKGEKPKKYVMTKP
ncbi:hypothetical protein RclHR1_17290003 [Rhizophagus clarus]|uniref:Galactose oxidase n=1 Tax=Rhizophagus clarus TaxID=94130 RepID=A0A2Z6QJS6_9GLOM|nr:hypothetical protein RclHR1_17290003 [Rhizophagus clarus]GES73153.1 hypothetical protein GLOIN_2v1632718 [Rhizophagus clarus]